MSSTVAPYLLDLVLLTAAVNQHSSSVLAALQFKSHKVYDVSHNPFPTRIVTIQSVQAESDSLVFTTAEEHNFEAKRTCGQLHAADSTSVTALAKVVETAVKVLRLPSTMKFAIPYKHLPESLDAELQALNEQLSAGLQQLTFG